MHGTVSNWCFWEIHCFELMLQKDAILQWNDTLIHKMVCLFRKDAIFGRTDMIFQERSHLLSEPLPLFRRGIWRLYKPAFIHMFRYKFSELQTLLLFSKYSTWSIKMLSEFIESTIWGTAIVRIEGHFILGGRFHNLGYSEGNYSLRTLREVEGLGLTNSISSIFWK